MKTIEWAGNHVRLIDQTSLPSKIRFVEIHEVDEMIVAIKRLVVRGAPAIGVAGAFAVLLSVLQVLKTRGKIEQVQIDAVRISNARPTAANLRWGVKKMLDAIDGLYDINQIVATAKAKAIEIMNLDVSTNIEMARRGADFVADLVDDSISVHTHCNAGGLACVDWGTALGVVRELHSRGKILKVFADETRPLLQGSRLTAFELSEMGIDHAIVVDGAGPSIIAGGLVDIVLVGSDRIAANGDIANKIGTYPLALAAHRSKIPFVVVAPESTVDITTQSGQDIDIELRDEDEILFWNGARVAPESSRALNPAFDVTPGDLVTAIITEKRVVQPRLGERLD